MMIDSLEGRILNGRYQIQSLIRSGGMASVMVPKQTAGAFSSTLDQPAYTVQAKRNKSGWFILLALVILLSVGGLSGCQKFIAKGDPQPTAALTPVETNQSAIIEQTQTVPAETALSTVGLTTPAVQAAPPGTETAQPGLETALPGGEAAQSGKIGRASCRERVSTIVYISVVAVSLDRKSTRLNSSHRPLSRMPSSA